MALCSDFIYKVEDLPLACYKVFEDMRQKKEFCDVTLNVGNHSIHAHRVVLAASIPYFRTSLGCKSKENEISLTDVNPAALEVLIDFAYKCEVKVTSENVYMLLTAACFLEVEHVRTACVKFLMREISPEHALSVRDFGLRLHCSDLVDFSDIYIRKNFVTVSKCEQFLFAPYSYVKNLISSDDLYVDGEEQVFEAVMAWVKADPTERSTEFPTLLSCVRMPFLQVSYLRDSVATEEMIKGSLQCRDILDDARDYHLFPDKKFDWKFASAPRLYGKSNTKISNGVSPAKKSTPLNDFAPANQPKVPMSKSEKLDFLFRRANSQPETEITLLLREFGKNQLSQNNSLDHCQRRLSESARRKLLSTARAACKADGTPDFKKTDRITSPSEQSCNCEKNNLVESAGLRSQIIYDELEQFCLCSGNVINPSIREDPIVASFFARKRESTEEKTRLSHLPNCHTSQGDMCISKRNPRTTVERKWMQSFPEFVQTKQCVTNHLKSGGLPESYNNIPLPYIRYHPTIDSSANYKLIRKYRKYMQCVSNMNCRIPVEKKQMQSSQSVTLANGCMTSHCTELECQKINVPLLYVRYHPTIDSSSNQLLIKKYMSS